ncbi:shikimate dehydrogenase [Methylotenera sp.]|uniref:shikimate dehydrogenase n=1 Tax=Methylotenera sp. TaxID=2051956 RepID=UPI00272FA216|nr:shikimate dehydrogenase [Methylotenera sp.]MDP2070610.1 shikimate dehydrogenase [Methylotenera sp.]MDP3004909.1 shikimate dehydrogenase [Methylotenera sp.]
MTDQYAVIGNPIAHSKSPLIHEAFARQTGQDISYERILAPLDGFDETVRELIKQGYKGVNVTVPFKFEAFQLANQYSSSALGAGAANTLSFKNQTIAADNTDGAGLVRDVEQNLNVQIAGKRVLLIGAGGAAEGVLQPMFKSKPKSITVVNRTLDKAIGMIKKVEAQSQFGNTILSACTFEELQGQAFDIVINATSAGLNDTALPILNTIFAKDCLAYDMMYGRETLFIKLAKDNGAQVADGLGMLVEQAAEAFYIWRGVRPETHSVMQQIRNLSQL